MVIHDVMNEPIFEYTVKNIQYPPNRTLRKNCSCTKNGKQYNFDKNCHRKKFLDNKMLRKKIEKNVLEKYMTDHIDDKM